MDSELVLLMALWTAATGAGSTGFAVSVSTAAGSAGASVVVALCFFVLIRLVLLLCELRRERFEFAAKNFEIFNTR